MQIATKILLSFSFMLAPAFAGSMVESPRLRQLQLDLAREKAMAVESFWSERTGQGPLVEAIAGDEESRLVTYLWRGDSSVERVEAHGGPYAASRLPFERLAGADVWYRTERVACDARFVYGLTVTRTVERRDANGGMRRDREESYPLDPLNPRTFNGGPIVELPKAPPDLWHADVGASKGRVEHCTIESTILRESRGVLIYRPAPFDAGHGCALALFLDGEECEKLLNLPTVLDNLIAAQKIPPTVGVLVDAQGTRGRDLVFSEAFVRFLAEELIPWTAMKCALPISAETTLIGGSSLGGLTAAYAAHRMPAVFGNVLSQSGAFWRARPGDPNSEVGWLVGEVAREANHPVRYYLEVGRFEPPSMLENNRRLRDVLRGKGIEVTYSEYNGGHDHFNWRTSVGDGIVALLGRRH